MSFLPEDDREYLEQKGLAYEELTEPLPNNEQRRGVLFPGFQFDGHLSTTIGASPANCSQCDLLIIIPSGYATTKLDSFYTLPRLTRSDGAYPDRANGESELLFKRKWQFWSRHLDDRDWRVGIDGLSTFLNYVRRELRAA